MKQMNLDNENFETVTLRLTFQYVHRDQIEDAEFEMVEYQQEQ